ncbi:MAG TPA: hypothetical protein VF771_16015 [Longimicrobiaceae bacterium]
MRRSMALVVIAGAPLLMATECVRAYELKVSPRPERGSPAITGWRGDDPVAIQSLEVERCRPPELRHVAWSVTRKEGGADSAALAPILYGQLPKGFAEERAPEPLAPGTCYVMHGDGTILGDSAGMYARGRGGFHVRGDGAVLPADAGFGETMHYGRQFGRAAVTCRRAFRRVRTPEQTAAVDARAFAVADTTVTCELMRTRFAETMRTEPSTEKTVVYLAAFVAALGVAFWADDALTRTLHLPKD